MFWGGGGGGGCITVKWVKNLHIYPYHNVFEANLLLPRAPSLFTLDPGTSLLIGNLNFMAFGA